MVNCSGPTPDTLDIVTKICLKAENARGVRLSYGIVERFAAKGHFLGAVSEGTISFLKETKEKVEAAEEVTETEEENSEETAEDEDKD